MSQTEREHQRLQNIDVLQSAVADVLLLELAKLVEELAERVDDCLLRQARQRFLVHQARTHQRLQALGHVRQCADDFAVRKVAVCGVAPGERVPNAQHQRLVLAQELLRNLDCGKCLLRRKVFEPPRLFVLARLLKVNAVGGTVEGDLALLATALRTNAPVHRRTKAFFLANAADRATQTGHLCGRKSGPKLPLWHLPPTGDVPEPHEQRLFERDLWKNRIKSGENASHRNEVGVRYRQLEHFYCSNLQGGFSKWQQA